MNIKEINTSKIKSADLTHKKSFEDKKWVWIPDNDKCFVSGFIVKQENNFILVNVNSEIRQVKEKDIMKMNPSKFDMIEDLAALSNLNEPSILHNIITRYQRNYIYTYSGLFLLAVNPYRELNIYSEKFIRKYVNFKKNDLKPHIYGVANEAYCNMMNNKENQSILITGESGAGKTENTKKVIEFLASIAGVYESLNKSSSTTSMGIRNKILEAKNSRILNISSDEISIDKKIIMTNPILEAFGNAKTFKNDNSSRFGKFIQIKFNGNRICGAFIEKYLLEKSRITFQNSNERNYHIFYQLLGCGDIVLKNSLFLEENSKYRFLKGTHNIKGVDDGEEFAILRKSFRNLEISEDVELFYYKIVAAVLHLGNIKICEKDGIAEIENFIVVEKICKLLEISSEQFVNSLLCPVIKAGNEFVTQNRTVEQAYTIIDALAKILYDKMFDQLINDLNSKLGTSYSTNFIGVLDIAGFEIFNENGFEQLCINYTNEKLQQFFNHHMFVLEQEIYKREKIDWNFIDFGLDLQPTIDLIEKSNPIGILSYLDEECVMPQASDKTFLNKLKNIRSKKFKNVYFKEGFILEHYAGDVEYLVKNWISKNKDPNFENINDLIKKSSSLFVSSLSFNDKNIKRGFFRTVAQKHKEQLSCLMKTLSMTNPHFVRCIIPNLKKSPNCLDNKLILSQLKCNGVLEGIRISRQGYPSRISYGEFVERYKILRADYNDIYMTVNPDKQEESFELLKSLNLSDTQYKLGVSKIFFKQGVLADIEDLRDIRIDEIMRTIQSLVRKKLDKLKLDLDEQRKRNLILLKKNANICVDLQKWNWWKLYIKIKPLLDVRKRDNELKEKDKIIEKLNKQIEDLRMAIDEQQALNKVSIQENEKLNKDLELEKIHSIEKEELVEGMRNELKKFEDENTNLKSNVKLIKDEFIRDKEIFLNKLKEQEVIKDDLHKKISYLENKNIQSANEEVKNLNMTILNLEKVKEKLLNEQKLDKNYIEDILKKNQEFKDIESKLTCKVQNLENDLQATRKKLEIFETNFKKLKDENNDLVFENEAFEKSLNKLEKDIEAKNISLIKANDDKKRLQSEFDALTINYNMTLKKVDDLKEQVIDLEKSFSDNSKIEKSNIQFEKIIKKLKEKLDYYIRSKHILRQEIDEIRENNSFLTQTKMEELFESERKYESEKKSLKKEIQILTCKNNAMKKELDNFKAISESSDDSTLEKLYNLLDKEKKLRREQEQKILEHESTIYNLQNQINDLAQCKCSMNARCTCKCLPCVTSCRVMYQKVDTLHSEELEKIITEINILIEGFNTTFYEILNKQKLKIHSLNDEIISLKDEILEKIRVINEIDNKFNLLNRRYNELNNLQKETLSELSISNSENNNLVAKNNFMENSLLEKNAIIETIKKKYEEVINKFKYLEEESKKESDLFISNFKQMSDACDNKIKIISDEKKKEILQLKSKLEETERKLSDCVKNNEILTFENNELRKNNKKVKIESLVINDNSKHFAKVKELEKNKLQLEKEIRNLKDDKKRYEMNINKISNENKDLTEKLEEIKKENFTISKENGKYNLQKRQMERELSDNQQMLDFLKHVSLTFKKKK